MREYDRDKVLSDLDELSAYVSDDIVLSKLLWKAIIQCVLNDSEARNVVPCLLDIAWARGISEDRLYRTLESACRKAGFPPDAWREYC